MKAEANGWGNKWIGKKNIIANGGTFKGSATWVYGWFYWEQVQTNEKGEVLKDSKGKDVKKSGYNFKTYAVWNTDQCEGLPTKLQSTDEEDAVEYTPLEGRVDNAEEYIKNIGANVTFGGDRAYYRPSTDTIGMPTFESFKTVECYYSTFIHEHIHWTKTEDRCKRKDNHASRKAYAFEELIAEMGAVYTMHNLGIKMDEKAFDNHLAYIDSWMKALDKDTRFIVDASMQADRAVKFLDKLQQKEPLKKVA
jgi:antirestriction protein ArdC